MLYVSPSFLLGGFRFLSARACGIFFFFLFFFLKSVLSYPPKFFFFGGNLNFLKKKKNEILLYRSIMVRNWGIYRFIGCGIYFYFFFFFFFFGFGFIVLGFYVNKCGEADGLGIESLLRRSSLSW